MKNIFIIALLAFISVSMAETNRPNRSPAISSIVDEYYALKDKSDLMEVADPCRPQTSCFKTACDLLHRFECDDVFEQENIRRACRGVWGGECIQTSISFLGKFEYDDNEEMVRLVNSCRGVYDTECVRYSCERLGSFGCDDLEEVERINQSCSGSRP